MQISLGAAGAIMEIIFIVFAAILLRGRGAFLISGYNTLPREKRAEYDTVKMCKFVGKVMLCFAFLTAVFLFAAVLEIWWLAFCCGGVFFVVMIFVLIYGNTGGRFKKPTGDERSTI